MVVGAPYLPAKQIYYNSDGSGRDSYIVQNYGGTINDYRSPMDFHSTYRSGSPPQTPRDHSKIRSPRLIMAERDMAIRQKQLCEFLAAPRSPVDHSLPKRTQRPQTQRSPRNRKLKSMQTSIHAPQSARRHGTHAYPRPQTTEPFLDRTAPMANTWLPTSFMTQGSPKSTVAWSNTASGFSSDAMTPRGKNKLQPIAPNAFTFVAGHTPRTYGVQDDAFDVMYRPGPMVFETTPPPPTAMMKSKPADVGSTAKPQAMA